MKKFLFKMAVFFSPFVFVFTAAIVIPIPDHSYNLSVIDKMALLKSAGSPKLVLTGGSNLAFSIDSASLESALDVPVINMGVHAGFGLGRMLGQISPFLQAGDMVLIVPEYQHFTSLWNGEDSAFNLIIDARQYHLLLPTNYYGFPDRFPGYLLGKTKSLPSAFKRGERQSGPYTRYGFNEYGDHTAHLYLAGSDLAGGEATAGKVNNDYVLFFSRFIDELSSRGITVMLSYPPYEEEVFSVSKDIIVELNNLFLSKENLQVISTPEDYCFDKSLFYDTSYHMNANGRRLRTELVIADIRKSGILP
jgi:hypothetical protein